MINDSEFLKMYLMKNPTHDPYREKAESICANLVLPNIKSILSNPYLNKTLDEEPDLNLTTVDLYQLSQITPRTKALYKEKRELDIESIKQSEEARRKISLE